MNINKVYCRQLDLVTPNDLDFPIAVIGAGGIGSWATLALAKMGCRQITVFDFDKVEDKNIPAQEFLDKAEEQKEQIRVRNKTIREDPVVFKDLKKTDTYYKNKL